MVTVNSVIHFNTRILDKDYVRFSKEDILKSIEKASKRFDVKNLIIITDVKKYFDFSTISFPVYHTEEIQDLLQNYNHSVLVAILAINSDEQAMKVVELFKQHHNIYYYGANLLYPATRFVFFNDAAKASLKKSKQILSKNGFPYFHMGDSENLLQGIFNTRHLEGDFVEIGTFQGKSALVALEYMKKIRLYRRAYFIDLYEGFVYDASKKSQDAVYYNSHTDTSLEKVATLLKDFKNAILVKSNIIENELPSHISKIAFAHIDVDMYEAIHASLNKVHPKMVSGGIIAVEDFGHTPLILGAMKAVNEFLESDAGRNYTPVYLRSGYMFMIKHQND